MKAEKSGRAINWLALFLLAAVAIAIVAIPVFVIMPFKAQTAADVAWSYRLRAWSPWVTVAATLSAFVFCFKLWRGARWYGRALMPPLLVAMLGVTWMARQNHFEWMFKPISTIAYARVNEAAFLKPEDMVMAVVINGDAAAYPIRQMAYHHVVNDSVGGRPITATY